MQIGVMGGHVLGYRGARCGMVYRPARNRPAPIKACCLGFLHPFPSFSLHSAAHRNARTLSLPIAIYVFSRVFSTNFVVEVSSQRSSLCRSFVAGPRSRLFALIWAWFGRWAKCCVSEERGVSGCFFFVCLLGFVFREEPPACTSWLTGTRLWLNR